jgi:hypothetical protein
MAEFSPADTGTEYANIINNNPYRFNVGLYSSDGRYQELKMGAINKLVLEDDFQDFYHKGYIIINNTFDAVERIADFSNLESATQGATTLKNDKGFIFKGDSRDILSIDIMPKLDEESLAFAEDKDANKLFRLQFNFAIYNTEEIIGTNPGEKFKKLYFWDMYNELLREKNSYFSTANYVTNLDTINATNAARGIYTGDAIIAFLNDFFKEKDGWPITIDEKNFDQGSTNIYFSAPARFKGIDCLKYLISRHVSTAKNSFDASFLRIERDTNNFTFLSLSDYFKRALNGASQNTNSQTGELYLETFKLGAYSDATAMNFELSKPDYVPADGLVLDKYGIINNFSFDPMPGIFTQQDLVSINVHSYNNDEKCFQIDEQRNTINSALSVYDTNYVLPFQKFSFDKAYRNYFPGEYKQTQKNIRNVSTIIEQEDEFNADQRLGSGRNKSIFNTVFMNNTVLFTVPGSTHRQAGRFIGVTRDGAYPYSDFDSKLLGIYFVVEARHHFNGADYFNELRCVKTYSYDNLFLNTNSK